MEKVIITGIESKLGCLAAQSLLDKVEKKDLIFVCSDKNTTKKLLGKHFNARFADYDSIDQITNAFTDGDSLLLTPVSRVYPKQCLMQRNIVDGAVRSGVKKVIYTSMIGAGSPSTYSFEAADHKFIETYIKISGLKYIFLRNAQFYENMISAFEQAAGSSGVLKNNIGRGLTSYVSRKDCAEVAACVAAGAGKINSVYNITGPIATSIENFCSIGSEVTGKKVVYRYIDDDAMRAFFDFKGVPHKEQGDWSKAVKTFQSCSDDMVTFGKAVKHGQMNICSNDFERLTGEKPKSLRDAFKEYEIS